MSKELLFAGSYDSQGIGGGFISNRKELVKACPEEFFRNENPWSVYIDKVLQSGGCKSGHWKWQVSDMSERLKMRIYFQVLLSNKGGLSGTDLRAVAGWMLSEMLTEVPEYIPREVKDKDEDKDEPWIHGERI